MVEYLPTVSEAWFCPWPTEGEHLVGWSRGTSGAVSADLVLEKVAFVWMGFHVCLLSSLWLVAIKHLSIWNSAGARL